MLTVIILILGIAAYLPDDYGGYEGRKDAEKIAANGSLDTLKERFHANNLLVRSVFAFAVTALVTFALHNSAGFSWWFAGAYGLYFITAFGYRFTLALNRERGLPDWYVSHDPRAAKMDKAMILGSAATGMQPQAFSRLAHTGFLVFGILIFIGSVLINLL